MHLTELKPAQGARSNNKRVGRGRSSGHGKTSTRGHNGQGQRSGESKRFGFEGGQTPLFRRLPKLHNFDQVINREWVAINIGALNGFSSGSEVNAQTLVDQGVLRKTTDSLRILGSGEVKIALTVKAHHFSASAKEKIEAAGGKAELLVNENSKDKKSKEKKSAKKDK
jgi:large subunit ribosomal protein L15